MFAHGIQRSLFWCRHHIICACQRHRDYSGDRNFSAHCHTGHNPLCAKRFGRHYSGQPGLSRNCSTNNINSRGTTPAVVRTPAFLHHSVFCEVRTRRGWAFHVVCLVHHVLRGIIVNRTKWSPVKSKILTDENFTAVGKSEQN